MKICVTGGTGLIARYVIKELAYKKNNTIYAIVSLGRGSFAEELYKAHNNVTVIEADMQDLENKLAQLIPKAIVIHTAFTRKNEGYEISKSLQYSYKLFSICKKYNAKGLINFSSRSVYKDPIEGELNKEDSPLDLDSLIATAKYGVELLLDGMLQNTNIFYTSLRCASVNELKTDNNMTRPLNVFVDCVIQDKPITVYDGSQRMSFIDPRDIAQAVMLLCETNDSWRPVYNVGPDESCTCSLLEMARKVVSIGEELGFGNTEIKIVEKDIHQTAGLDSSLIRSELGYEPKYSLDLMIKSLFEMKRKKHD